jgi:hypothetical protein
MEHIEVKNNRLSASNPSKNENIKVYFESWGSKAGSLGLGVELCRTLEARERLLLPGNDDIEVAKIEEQEAEKKRGRSDTVPVASKGRPGKKRK